MKEADIQIGILDWIREEQNNYPVLETIYHVPNSFFCTNYGVINWLKKLGLRKGVWDLCIPIDNGVYPFAYLEIKSSTGKLSKDQIRFRELIFKHSDRFPIFVEIRDVETGITFIKRYLGLEEENE